jgi:hypothetical protein
MFPKRSVPTGSKARRSLLVAAGCVAGAFAPASAQAGVDLQVKPPTVAGIASSVAVGDNAQGTIEIANGTTGAQAAQNFVVDTITLVPSCGSPGADRACQLAPGADLGVITVGPNASGSGACGGTTFAVSVLDATTGRVTFAPSSEVSLSASGPGATCVISFNYTVNKMAVKDTSATGGVQTDLVAWAQGYALADPTPRSEFEDMGTSHVTVARDTPDLTARASPGVPVGGGLSVTGDLAGTQPDGNVTFDLFGPADPTCAGAPMYSATLPVNGNGPYHSPSVTASAAGTYRWVAFYDGDADNAGVSSACGDPAAATTVGSGSTTTTPGSTTPGGSQSGGDATTPGATTSRAGTGTDTTRSGATGAAKRVRLDAFALTRRTFARATTPTAIAATAAAYLPKKKKKGAKKGTTIKYTLSAPATVTIVVERIAKGRRAAGYANRCVKATKKLAKRKACTMYVTTSTLKRTYKTAGAKKLAFSGRAGRKALKAGRYRLRATASAGVGTTSAERRATFRIVKR